MSPALWPSPTQGHAWWLAPVVCKDQRGNWLTQPACKSLSGSPDGGQGSGWLRESVASSRAQGPISLHAQNVSFCAGSFPTSYGMAAAVPAITSRHGYVLNSLGVGKPFSQAAQCPAPFLWWLELPTFRVITDKLGFALALGRGSLSPQSCLGKGWRRPVTAKLKWSSAGKEEERIGIEQAASSVCRSLCCLSHHFWPLIQVVIFFIWFLLFAQ